MTKFHEVSIGDTVRSYDFPWDLPRHADCYVEGVVRRIVKAGTEPIAFGCDRYAIEVRLRVFSGEVLESPDPSPAFIYPPVNGTPSMISDTNGVVRVTELPPDAHRVPSPVQGDYGRLEERIIASLPTSAQEAARRGEPLPPTAEPRWSAGLRPLTGRKPRKP